MLDHIGLTTCNIARARAFYAASLAPLGYSVLKHFGTTLGMGTDDTPDFWLWEGLKPGRAHVAFVARERRAVDAFYAAAMAAGAQSNGPPGLRPDYHANYYSAFVVDAEGNNIEVVCHNPEE